MFNFRLLSVGVSVVVLSGCAGKFSYTPPSTSYSVENEKIVNQPFNKVWAQSVSQLSKQFFVINNIDKDSGLINISYSGNPQPYIDCGRIMSFVQNARGKRTYDFPAAEQFKEYEILSNAMYGVTHQMKLEGRANLILQPATASTTRVTVNARYNVTRETTVRNVGGGLPQRTLMTESLNTGGSLRFPDSSSQGGTVCVATGELERSILNSIQ